MKSTNTTEYRRFKICINLLFIHIYTDSDPLKISNKFILIIYSTWFTLTSFFLGWWGTSFRHPFQDIENTLKAIHININGVFEFSHEIESMEYDDFTNHVYNNLSRETYDRLSLNHISLILDFHIDFLESNQLEYSQQNIEHIIWQMKKSNVQSIIFEDIKDVFEAIESYKRYTSQSNFA